MFVYVLSDCAALAMPA